MDTMTSAVLDQFHDEEKLDKRWHYPIEAMIRNLGKIRGSFSLGILDCCREKVPTEDLKLAVPEAAARGTTGAS